MSRPKKLTLDAIVDTDGICASQTPGAAGNMTINGSSASGGSVSLSNAHLVEVTCASNDSARTFTITGTDYRGEALTESIAGSSGSTTVGTKYFKTITQVAVDAATAGAITVGFNGKATTPWFPVNYRGQNLALGFGITVTGTINYTVQHTFDNLTNIATGSLATFSHEFLSSQTASADGSYDAGITAMRCISNSGSGALDLAIVESSR